MEIYSLKLWIVLQLVIDFIVIALVLYFTKHFRSKVSRLAAKQAADQVIGMIEPLLEAAKATSKAFDTQLQEKNQLIRHLTEKLDSRIISLNLLLNRAEGHLSMDTESPSRPRSHVYDQQSAILDLFAEGDDAETIARKLSMPKGEVDLVLDLKNKFQ
jgi:hypothetical protein